jgi:prophage regulatory protein
MRPNHSESTAVASVPPAPPAERLLRLPLVLELTARGRTATLDDVKAGRFPKPIKVGAASMWLQSEVHAWIAARVRDSRGA